AITLLSGKPLPTGRRTHVPAPGYGSYRTADGYLALGNIAAAQWEPLCRALGRPDLIADPRFGTPRAFNDHVEALVDLLDELLASRTTREWLEVFDTLDVSAAPIYNYLEMAADPQVLANEYVIEMETSEGAPMRAVGMPVKLSETPGSIRSAAPRLGQH